MPRTATRRYFTATTQITVLRPDAAADPDGYGDPADDPTTVAEHVAASIGNRVAQEDRDGTVRQVTTTRLVCDLVDLTHTDLVLDETTGITWAVQGITADRRLGLDYLSAELLRIDGAG